MYALQYFIMVPVLVKFILGNAKLSKGKLLVKEAIAAQML